jgi:hypothetical protein
MAAILWKGNTGLVPQWSGADLQLADRVTDTDVYRGPIWICRGSVLSRGTWGSGARTGWVVTSSKVQAERKGIGLLTISWEIGGPFANPAFLPLDDFRCEIVELYPKVERNKHMYGMTYPVNPGDRIDPLTIKRCYAAVNGDEVKSKQARTLIMNMASRTDAPPAGSNWADQADWATVLLDWLDHGNETYYMCGIKYSYIWHQFTLPALTLGGVIESSPFGGPLAGETAFSWLRLSDQPESAGVNGSVYRITSTWLGGAKGHWDKVLYS